MSKRVGKNIRIPPETEAALLDLLPEFAEHGLAYLALVAIHQRFEMPLPPTPTERKTEGAASLAGLPRARRKKTRKARKKLKKTID